VFGVHINRRWTSFHLISLPFDFFGLFKYRETSLLCEYIFYSKVYNETSAKMSANNIRVTLAVTSVITAVAVYSAPQLLPERFSRAVIRFFIYDIFLAFFYTVFIWPFFVNPLRHLPGPTVSPQLLDAEKDNKKELH